jgi:(S)-ureidoglycine aminohydrolase
MRATNQLVHSRARVRQRYALFPLEGYPLSRLPAWRGAEVRVLASPAIGAGFAQYLIDLQVGGGTTHKPDGRVETFLYVMDGQATLHPSVGTPSTLNAGGFALLPPAAGFDLTAAAATKLLVLRKAYEPADGVPVFAPLIGRAGDVPAPAWMGIEQARLQALIPDELPFDLSMNIFAFDPGFGLPYVETHVMEHGALILQGKGLYYLDGDWLEVEAGDFIWMGPFCPQSFYATGPVPAKYIYYKNVNREIEL